MNIFKTQQQTNNTTTDQRSSYFKPYNAPDKNKAKAFNMMEKDFPDFIANNTISVKSEDELQALSYMKASTQEIIILESNEIKLEPGWVSLSYDSNRNVVTKPSSNNVLKEGSDKLSLEEYSEHANYIFNQMAHKWERYKENFIDLNGIEEYDRIYLKIIIHEEEEMEEEEIYDNYYEYGYDNYWDNY